jgi:hypothetical protein
MAECRRPLPSTGTGEKSKKKNSEQKFGAAPPRHQNFSSLFFSVVRKLLAID